MRFVLAVVLACFVVPATAQQPAYPIKAADGTIVANHSIAPELAGAVERLPGAVILGNPNGDVTLAEFYDLNCPYCRTASADVEALMREDARLRLVLVPFPVLGVPSITAGRVELAVARLGTPAQFWEFHRKIFAGRGVIDGTRALTVASELGFAQDPLIVTANDDAITETMKAHVRLGNRLALMATPAFVVGGVAIVGHPGRIALREIVAAMRRCGKVVC
jgi:protein-disulfide isomerase